MRYYGDENILNHKAYGFSGSRDINPAREDHVRQIITGIAEFCNWNLVTGGARGTDKVAEDSALKNRSRAIRVIVSAAESYHDRPDNARRLNAGHLLIAAPFDEPWNVKNAMRRNEVILNMSQFVILGKCGWRGGTFDMGKKVLTSKKPLFVIAYTEKSTANQFMIESGGIPLKMRNGKMDVQVVKEVMGL